MKIAYQFIEILYQIKFILIEIIKVFDENEQNE